MFSFVSLAPADPTAELESRQGRPNRTAAGHAGGTGGQVPAPPRGYSAWWQAGCVCTGAGGAGEPSRVLPGPRLLAGALCLKLGSFSACAVPPDIFPEGFTFTLCPLTVRLDSGASYLEDRFQTVAGLSLTCSRAACSARGCLQSQAASPRGPSGPIPSWGSASALTSLGRSL